MPNIYAKELDTLTVEDVLEWRKRNGSNAMYDTERSLRIASILPANASIRVVSVVDLEEMTPEQEKKLMYVLVLIYLGLC